jgi:hypothetical protein
MPGWLDWLVPVRRGPERPRLPVDGGDGDDAMGTNYRAGYLHRNDLRGDWVQVVARSGYGRVIDYDPRDNVMVIRAGAEQPNAAAEKRAWLLLLEHLTPKQVLDVRSHNSFEVIGSRKGRYRINCATYLGNITDLSKSRKICIYAKGKYAIPLGDHLLAQKLAIETNEPHFLRQANFIPR